MTLAYWKYHAVCNILRFEEFVIWFFLKHICHKYTFIHMYNRRRVYLNHLPEAPVSWVQEQPIIAST